MDLTLQLQLKQKEKDLVDACIQNERWAQKKIYEDYYSSMMGVCLRYSNNSDEAVDILHEGFIKIFKNIAKYKPGTSLNAWMRRIVINTAIDHFRKMSKRRTEDLETAYSLSSSEPDALSSFTEKEILGAIQKLSPAYRTVFNLYIIEGYAHKEIAEQLGISESTSRSNLVKARIKLKQYIKSVQ